MRTSLLALCLSFMSALASASCWQADAAMRQSLAVSVAARQARLFDGEHLRTGRSSIEASSLLLDAMAVGAPSEQLARLLAALPSLLDRDPTSKTYGNIRWYQGDARVVDRNGIEFVTRKAALAWLCYRDALPPVQREQLRELLELARIGVPRHAVRISYTNIFLMKTWNLIALGEGLDDPELARQGYAMLADWLAHTRRPGINEYFSPSYYDIDLENLALIHNLSRDSAARRLARAELDWLWHDIALNWYRSAERLGGTHSRDYNRLFNTSNLNRWVLRAGWSTSEEQASLPSDGPYESMAWAPPPASAARWLEGPFPRRITGRWGEEPEKRHTHFLGREFSIASAESGYYAGHDNSPLVINLGRGQAVPIINFFMDGRRDHYGQNKTLEAGSGHMKALHLRPFLSSVQRDNAVLFLASMRDPSPELVALESVVTLPADAEYWLDDRPLDVAGQYSRWRADPETQSVGTQIAVEAREGQASLLLSDRNPEGGVGVSQRFRAREGEDYRLSASIEGGPVALYLNFLDAQGRLIGPENIRLVQGGQGKTKEVEHVARAPEGAVWCKAWLYSTTKNLTELHVNDLRLEVVQADGARRMLAGFDFVVPRSVAIPVPAGATLFVRRGGAVAALRLLGAWDVAGQPAGFTLHNDGLIYGALRLTAIHAERRPGEGRGTLAMWAWAGEGYGDAAAFAGLRKRLLAVKGQAALEGDVLTASVSGDQTLQLQANVLKGAAVAARGGGFGG
ncbi:MAG: hypothetical protein CGU28_02920 [Candidatus Dactylopiibacterium carminicum]|nr:MAG: hypothetical protein CGU28_02920 [Candidatus Dactylopiibacterium carminicum]